ncbi:MAG: helix-turn-helix domain-containing protein [Burkholderiaceae bacterium]|nr:helix-turn-helix domain-containing protein [Burkholderiaceae bacterium]
MSNIAKVIGAEITRLARKEVRGTQKTVKAVTAQYRREIANLKSQLAALKRQVTALEKQARENGQAPQATAALPQTRFVPKGLISTRKRLGLSATDLAKMLGVSAQTIYNWERGATKPRADQFAKLASLRHVGKRQVQAYLAAG